MEIHLRSAMIDINLVNASGGAHVVIFISPQTNNPPWSAGKGVMSEDAVAAERIYFS